ncbi:hypothetical protein SAMN02949497_0023 [Methylomagnum ishizawai]|uniref:Uncharacterized protein n=1 Tax=Methylomagnum ishizawai TaxID=1760988 RepID=A0A1Y6D515_9GAMM|nr:hypothetical protein [Methylomagnum ishizawai]SMF97767.1 hypothetical protein SAMN02949497_0023 [Methylomagnum ishizawai]
MSHLNLLLHLMNQRTSIQEAQMERAAALILAGALVLIAVALMLL